MAIAWSQVNEHHLNKPTTLMHINEAQTFLSSCLCLLETVWMKGCQCSGGVWHRLSTLGGPPRNILKWRLIHSCLRLPSWAFKNVISLEKHVWSPDRHKCPNSCHGFGVARLYLCHNCVDSLNRKERCKFVAVFRKTLIKSPPPPPVTWWKWPNTCVMCMLQKKCPTLK